MSQIYLNNVHKMKKIEKILFLGDRESLIQREDKLTTSRIKSADLIKELNEILRKVK